MVEILVVCTANVCRSQYARALLLQGFADSEQLGALIVRSAGTHAETDENVCDFVTHDLPLAEGEPGTLTTKPRLLKPGMIESADLVLTAERSHRGFVARMSPSSRTKTFTILEALQYARLMLEDHDPVSDDANADANDRFQSLVARMNSSRGVKPITQSVTRRRLFRRPLEKSTLDIRDGHNLGDHPHHATLRLIRESTIDLNSTMKTILAERQ